MQENKTGMKEINGKRTLLLSLLHEPASFLNSNHSKNPL